MSIGGDAPRDLSRLVVPLGGSLEATGDVFEPYRVTDAAGTGGHVDPLASRGHPLT